MLRLTGHPYRCVLHESERMRTDIAQVMIDRHGENCGCQPHLRFSGFQRFVYTCVQWTLSQAAFQY